MPFSRKTLTELRAEAVSDLQTTTNNTKGFLRFGNLQTLSYLQAAALHLQLGYLDWIARQSVPFTAEEEYLDAWAALKNVFRKEETKAVGAITLQGSAGAVIPAASEITRDVDSVKYTVDAEVSYVVDGLLAIPVTALDAGADGNADVGTSMTLGSAAEGVQSTGTVTTALTGGADTEEDDDLFDRMLLAYQELAQGGCEDDYKKWALEVSGVTRAWVNRNGFGAGTVVVYTMLDDANAAHDGFPQGSNGVATLEPRGGAKATGDQLTVANYIYSDDKQPVTALIYSVSPIASPQDFTITGLATSDSATKTAVSQAIKDVLKERGDPKAGTVDLSYIEVAIAAISGTTPFVITSPTQNITRPIGYLPTLGNVTFG